MVKSSKPGKQRKAQANAPQHIKRRNVAARLMLANPDERLAHLAGDFHLALADLQLDLRLLRVLQVAGHAVDRAGQDLDLAAATPQ